MTIENNCSNCSYFKRIDRNRAKCERSYLPAYENAGEDCEFWDLNEDSFDDE